MPKTKPTNFRLSPEAKAIVLAASQQNGVSQTAIVEMAVREYAKKHRIKIAPSD